MKWAFAWVWRISLIAAAVMWALGALLPAHAAPSQTAQAAPAVRVLIDDVPLPLTPSATVQNDALYLPLRPLADHFQAGLRYASGVIEVRRADGTVFTLRLGRLEIWSNDIVVSIIEAPILLVNGVTMVPRGAVEALFDTLTVWDRQNNTLLVVTRKQFHSTVTAKPEAPPSAPAPGATATRSFVAEFQPEIEPPVVASGFVTMGLALGGGTGVVATSRLQFRTHSGDERIDGTIALAGGTAAFQAAGTITVRAPSATFALGNFSRRDSPLTLYDQGLTGIMYQGRMGSRDATLFGGVIPNSTASVYGLNLRLASFGSWLVDGGLLYMPEAGGVVVSGRLERPVRSAVTIFGEAAGGTSVAGSGTAWRVGATTSLASLTASISYLSLSAGFPTVGNASLFAGRSGPLLELSYRPSARLALLGSAAVLSGAASGLPDRLAYSLLTVYRPSPSWGLAADLRIVEDSSSGVRTRSTSANAATTLLAGPWALVLAAGHVADANLLTGTTSATSTFSLRAGYAFRTGLPVWAEVTRSIGDTEAWGYALGMSYRLSPSMDLTTQLRHTIYTLPTASSDSSLEVGVSRPLQNGAYLTLGAGLRYTSNAGGAAPYLAFQYGYPVYVYGPLRVGQISGVLFVDGNGNGRRDSGEAGVRGVVLRVDDRRAAMTNESGTATVEGVREGEYRVTLDEDTIPAGLLPLLPGQVLRVAAGETATAEFALVPAASLYAIVFLDENDNGIRDANEQGIAGVVVTLQPRGLSRTSAEDGVLEFQSLLPGDYTLTVDPRSLPSSIRVKEGSTFAVTLTPGGSATVAIPLVRPVVRTF